MLFDERKNPFHLMLRDLVNSGGLESFFKTFEWLASEGLSERNIGDETGDLFSPQAEFLDSWLSLLERMVNPKMILETPHIMAAKSSSALGYSPFDAIQYLITVHKRAFDAIDYLWVMHSRKYFSDQTSEHILSILCHILKGETIINEHLKKEKESEASTVATSLTTSTTISGGTNPIGRSDYPGVNQDHLQQLIDMGFAREAVVDALMQCQTIEQATEFLLSTPQASYSSNWTARSQESSAQDVDMVAEETADVKVNKPAQPVKPKREEPLSKSRIDTFTDNLLPGSLRLMDELPSTVYKVCDLILTVAQRNGESWCSSLLKHLLDDIMHNSKLLLEMSEPLRAKDKKSFNEWTSQLKNAPEANKVAVRVHLYSLLFDEMKIQCANLMHKCGAIDCLVALLEVGLDLFSLSKDYFHNSSDINNDQATLSSQTPKWLAPTILLIDLYEKGAVASARRAPLLNNQQRTWQYFDERSGRWTPHVQVNNKIIDDAYKNGEQYVRYSVGRKHYFAQFSSMLQINEDTSNLRPIMMTLSPGPTDMTIQDSGNTVPVVPKLREHQSKTLIRVCVGFMQLPIDPNSLQAVMRLSFRLTREYELAVMFAEMGGIRALQNLPESSQFTGFVSLATLIIRHVLEEPAVLHQTMEKVIRSTTQHCQHNQREMHCLLRVLGSAACRDEDIFKKLAIEILRITPPPIRRDDDDSRTKSDGPQIIKLLPPKPTTELIKPSSVTRCVIADLLDSLTVPIQMKPFDVPGPVRFTTSPASPPPDTKATNDLLPRSPSSFPPAVSKSNLSNDPPRQSETTTVMRQHNPLLNHSIVLRLLAELTRSYSVVPKIIAEHTFTPSTNESINEDISALAFILDNILPTTQTHSDRDGPALARVFLAALAACNHCVEAQIAVVNEVKASLNRAALMSESCEKHARLQSLATMIGTMIDCCPAVSPQQSNTRQNNSTTHQQRLSNNIVRLFVRKGLVTDLARIPHSLDLSAPHMFATINAILKPLETLSRFVNLPSQPGQSRHHAPPTKKAHCSSSSSSSDLPEDSATPTLNIESNNAVAANTNQLSITNNCTAAPEQSQLGTANQEQAANQQANPTPTNTNCPNDVNMLVGNNDNSADVSMTNSASDQMLTNSTYFRTEREENSVIEAQVQFEVFNDEHHQMRRENENMSDEAANDQEFDAPSRVVVRPIGSNERNSESRDNVVNSNGAESESGDDSRSDDDEDDEDEDNGEVSGVDEREEDADDEDEDEDDDEDEDEDHVDDDDDHVDDDEGDDDENLNAFGDNQFADDYRIYNGQLNNVLNDIEEVFLQQSNVIYSDRLNNIIPGMYDGNIDQHETTAPSLPPPPGNVGLTHPLLLRRLDHHVPNTLLGPGPPPLVTRAHRYGGRPRLLRGPPGSGNPQWHGGATARHPPQTILQQLLGPNTVQEVMSLTNQIVGPNRLFVADFQHWLANEDELYPDTADSHTFSSSHATALASIPLVMARWTEESRILDGGTMHDCMANIKQDIVEALEKFRDEENLDRQEKRKKLVEDEEQAQQKKCKEPAAARQQQQQVAVQQPSVITDGSRPTPPWTQPIPEEPADAEPVSISIATPATSIPALPPTGQQSTNSSNEHQEMQQDSQPSVADENTTTATGSQQNQNLEPVPMAQVSVEEQSSDSGPTNYVREPSQDSSQASSQQAPAVEVEQSSEQSQQSSQTSNSQQESIAPISVPLVRQSEEALRMTDDSSTPLQQQPPPQQQQQQAAATSHSAEGETNNQEGEIPDGVDPSFLAALPEDIRQEVLAEQWRLRRMERANSQGGGNSSNQPSNNEQASTSSGTAFPEVNPEFLAALPAEVQEEVLAQQRAEQQRQAALNSNPDQPVDPAIFIQTLAPNLRRQVLADMDDSLLSLLPSDLANEAQALRRELLTSNVSANSTLSRLLRTAAAGRMQRARYTITSVPEHVHTQPAWSWALDRPSGSIAHGGSSNRNVLTISRDSKFKGRQLLDCEGLTCLVILLFVEEPRLNIARLHRVIRNLSYHQPTRQWVVNSMLSIIDRARSNEDSSRNTNISNKGKRGSKNDSSISSDLSKLNHSSSWLSISMDAALGCRASVFSVPKPQGTSGSVAPYSGRNINIHNQAAPSICRHMLEALIALAKSFPQHFFPEALQASDESSNDTEINQLGLDFWEILAKLDSLMSNLNKKGRGSSKQLSASSNTQGASPHDSSSSEQVSPISRLIGFLAHPIVKRSFTLTDRLLHLLAVISLAFPAPLDNMYEPWQNASSSRPGLNSQYARRSHASHTIPPHIFYGRHGHSHRPVSVQHQSAPPQNSSSRPNQDNQMITESSEPPSASKSTKKSVGSTSDNKSKQPLVTKPYLKLAVDVLTSKSCSEEGLDDVTSLLSRLSRSCNSTRATVLELLMDGARQLGHTVCLHISTLKEELKDYNQKLRIKQANASGEGSSSGPRGVVHDRFTNDSVIISAPASSKSGREVQLPSMAALTSKNSSQAFFLRILKVIIQLRETSSSSKPSTSTASNATTQQTNRVNQQPSNSTQRRTSDQQTPLLATSSATPDQQVQSGGQSAMEVDPTSQSNDVTIKVEEPNIVKTEESLSIELQLDDLWETLSQCLLELAETPDHHAVLVLQPAVEAFFLVHSPGSSQRGGHRQDEHNVEKNSQTAHIDQEVAPISPSDNQGNEIPGSSSGLSYDTQKFLKFAETHRVVLNHILRQSTTPLSQGPFAVLVDHTRVLDFDVKRRYFRQELERLDEGIRRDDLGIHVRRDNVFEESFRELHRRLAEEWKNRFFVVFEDEEGQDAGGLLREWYTIISREIFNPMYALFTTSPGDRVTYMINSASHCNTNHLTYFKFVGRVIAKAIYDNKLLDCYFTRSFYKHILGKPVKYTDMESEDYSFYQGLVFLLEHDVKELGYELTFSVEVREFGVTEVRELKPNGSNIPVTEENKHEYVRLVCQEKMTGSIRKQLNAFLEGFYDIIPKRLISIFNEQELELLISGLPNIDIDDLKASTEYHKYLPNSLQIQWFWRALRSFDQADRAKLLQFVTGTSKVPLQGFASLEGMNGVQKFQIHRDERSTDRLPSAHTCFNQLDLPVYETYDKLRYMLLKAIQECSEGFGLA